MLKGVAGFLFVPMAEAVVFAMIASFILSRTLVPTLAMYLLKPHDTERLGYENAAEHGHGGPPSRNPLVRFQRGFETRFGKLREGYRDLLVLAMKSGRVFIIGFMVVVLASFGLRRSWAATSSRRSTPARSPCTSAPRSARAWTRPRCCSAGSRPRSARSCRPTKSPRWSTTSASPTARSTWSTATRRVIGPQDGDIFVSPEAPRHQRDRRLREDPARGAAPPVPRRDLLVPAGRHHRPDPELRRARPHRPADRRSQRRRQPRLRRQDPGAG